MEGVVYEYPFKYEELANNGWEDLYGLDDNYSLQPQSEIEDFEVKKDTIIHISLYNPSDENMILKDCMVSSITLKGGDGCPNVKFPCDYDFVTTFPEEKHSEYLIETAKGTGPESANQYAIPFESADGYSCRLLLDVSDNYGTITSARYEMLDLVFDSGRTKELLDAQFRFYFYGDMKTYQETFGGSDYYLELEAKEHKKFVEDFLVDFSGFDTHKVIYRDKLDGFIDKILNSASWDIEIEEDGNLKVDYSYPNTWDILENVENGVIKNYGENYSDNQEAFDYFAERLNNIDDPKMTEDSMTVKVIDGTMDNTDYTGLFYSILGFKQMVESEDYYVVETDDDTTKTYFLIEELFTITYEGEQYSIVAGYPVNGPLKVGQKFYLTTDDENILLTVKELELSDGSHPKSVNEYDNVAVWVDNYIKDYVESGDKLYLYEEW